MPTTNIRRRNSAGTKVSLHLSPEVAEQLRAKSYFDRCSQSFIADEVLGQYFKVLPLALPGPAKARPQR